ncbi:GumC family protein [Bradyrhizobium guangdongense]
MLQKLNFEDDFQATEQEDRGHLLRPGFYWSVFKRRWPYFVLPFVVIASAGVAGALLWPATYLSEGKVLVQTQQIPSDLVRPTVTNAAQERIQVIEQRTMTRDNLIAIADRFQLFPEKRTLMSPTELVELMRKSTKIEPVDLHLDFKQRTRAALENPTIVFSVGFLYNDPAVATRVANELMTRILNEDLRDRTSRATDTTKFLEREVQRLQSENVALDAKIAQLKLVQQARPSPLASGPDAPAGTLGQLKAELIQKGALYSERHPAIQSLKRQIEAMEKAATTPVAPVAGSSNTASSNGNDATALAASLEALTAQQDSLQKNLETATAKLMAARLGENLEKDQQSEKLEVIEQPTVPQEPVKPNRPKVAALAFALAFAAGAGLTFLMEFSDKAIRRSSDMFSVVEFPLIVSIPYITTVAETRRHRRRIIVASVTVIAAVVGLAAIAYFFLPPLDLMFAKARVGLFRL